MNTWNLTFVADDAALADWMTAHAGENSAILLFKAGGGWAILTPAQTDQHTSASAGMGHAGGHGASAGSTSSAASGPAGKGKA